MFCRWRLDKYSGILLGVFLIEHILDNCYINLHLVTIHDVTYKDIIRTCGYHYDETNWDAEKQEFVDYEGYGIGCYHLMSYRKKIIS